MIHGSIILVGSCEAYIAMLSRLIANHTLPCPYTLTKSATATKVKQLVQAIKECSLFGKIELLA